MLYLIPIPETQLERRGRAAGWRHLPIEREGRKQLRELAAQLNGRGVQEVYASDLDEQAGRVLADELKVPLRTDFCLRRFNVGRNHAKPLDAVEHIFEDLLKKWDKNRDIPMRGGDSLTSFEKRMLPMYEKLTTKDSVAFLTDDQTIRYWRDLNSHAFIRNGNPIHKGKVYCIRRVV